MYVEQEHSQIPTAEPGPSWGGQAELAAKPAHLQARLHTGQRPFTVLFLFSLSLTIFSFKYTLTAEVNEWVLTHLCFRLFAFPPSHMMVLRLATCVGRGYREGEVV